MCWKWSPFASRQDWTRRAIFWKVLASTSAVTARISSVMFAFKASMFRGLGKLSLSDIPIRNNQAASDRASAVAEVPSKWRGRRKRTEFWPCWRVKCGMSLHPAGSIQLRVPHRPVDLQSCWRFPYMQLFWWFLLKRWDQLCAAGTSHTKHQSSLNEGVLHVSRWDFQCPNTRILRIDVSRQVKPRLDGEPSVVQNGRVLLKKCLKPSTICHSFHMVRHTLQTHYSSFLTQRTYSCSNLVAISSLVLELLKKCRV